MNIGVDIDGVLANFNEAFYKVATKITNRNLPYEVENWGFPNWKLSPEEMKSCWKKIHNTRNFWISLNRYEGVYSPFLYICRKHNVYLITTRSNSTGLPLIKQITEWLGLKYDSPNVSGIIVTKHKGKVCEALEISAMIDDKPENLIDVNNYSPKTKAYLLNQTWNSNFLCTDSIIRVNSFQEFADVYNNE